MFWYLVTVSSAFTVLKIHMTHIKKQAIFHDVEKKRKLFFQTIVDII